MIKQLLNNLIERLLNMADKYRTKELPHDHGTGTGELLKTRPDEEDYIKISKMFDLINDSTRLKILWLLCHTEECVINIAAAVDMSSPAVSHHLRILKQAGVLTSHKDGKEVHYTLADTHIACQVHKLIDIAFGIKH